MSQNAWGICVYEDIIVVSIEGKLNDQMFRFYDQEGNYYEEHSITAGSSQYGSVLATSRKSLLFTHHDRHFLLSVDINLSKKASTVYQGNNMKHPIGVTRDPNGNVYVACFGSNNVLQFDENRKFIREIIKADPAVTHPFGIRVKRLGGGIKLILTTKDKLLVYYFVK